MEINYVTTNKGKVHSLQRHLDVYGIIVIQKAVDLPEPRSDDVQVIAENKAYTAFEIIKEPLVVLDAGFYIDSLNGFPRAFVNFALDTIGLDGILKLVEGKERTSEFKHSLAYIDGELDEPIFFNSSVKGRIADNVRGKKQDHLWSDLGLIFIPEHSEKTLGEMTPKEYADFWEKYYANAPSCQREFGKWYSDKVRE